MERVDAEMTCQELVELITAWLDNALAPADRARFDAHVAECPYCQLYLDQIQRTASLLGGMSEQAIGPAARDELLVLFRDWKRG